MNYPALKKQQEIVKTRMAFMILMFLVAVALLALSQMSFAQIPSALPTEVTDGITSAFTFLGVAVAAMVGIAGIFKLGKWVYGFFV